MHVSTHQDMMYYCKKHYLVVITIQTIYAGMFLLSKAAFDRGMNNFIFVFYRQAAATLFLIPLAVFFERKTAPSLSFMTLCKTFMLSLFGITLSLDIYGISLVYTSATLAAATTNCLPVITFFLAVLLRMETVKLKTIPGIAKVVGIAVCMGGVVTLAFYKGPSLSRHEHHHQGAAGQVSSGGGSTWIKGCFLMLMSNTLWGFWLVLQAGVMKSYPSKLLFTTLQCFLSTIQSFIIAIGLERDPNQWKLGWNVRLIAVAYCGILVTGVTYYLQAWVIEKKGPVFLAMSTPFALVITIFCSSLVLGEIVSLGSVVGGILLVVGLYCVLWGKSKEGLKMADKCLTTEKEMQCSDFKDGITTETKSSPLLCV